MIPILEGNQTSEDLRALAHDLLAIRASRLSGSAATLYDDETRDVRILSDGALACLQGAAELDDIDADRRWNDRRLYRHLAVSFAIIAAIVFASRLIPDPPASPEELRWLSMAEQRLSASEGLGKPRDDQKHADR